MRRKCKCRELLIPFGREVRQCTASRARGHAFQQQKKTNYWILLIKEGPSTSPLNKWTREHVIICSLQSRAGRYFPVSEAKAFGVGVGLGEAGEMQGRGTAREKPLGTARMGAGGRQSGECTATAHPAPVPTQPMPPLRFQFYWEISPAADLKKGSPRRQLFWHSHHFLRNPAAWEICCHATVRLCQHWTSLKSFPGTPNHGHWKMSVSQSVTFASQGQHAALQNSKINEPHAQQNFWFQMKMTSNPQSVALGHPP